MLLKVLYFNVAPLVLIYRTDNVMSWNISLSPTGPISTWQNEDVNLTCDGPPSINATKFNLNQRAILNNDNRFEMKEINKNVSVLTIYSAYMETCVNIRLTCQKIYDSRIYASNKVQVEVKPLIQTVHLSQTERIGSGITENTTVNFTCSTLCNCTTPAIIWNVRDRDNIKFNQTECLRSTNLTTSRLTYMVNRLDNGSYVNCAASNENGHTVYSSNITLRVYYPPGNMAMSGGSGSEYSVIEHTRGTLNCSVNGGNPLPTLSWNCSFANVVTLKSTLIVQSTITWNSSRDNSKTCACISNHPLYNQPEVATKTINVLYPPLLATMPNVNVIENSSLTVVSYVKDSNPDVSEVHWKKADSNKVLSNSFTLSVPKVTKNSKGSYICSAQNIMVPSDGNIMNGTDRKQFYLDVLYPPHVHGLNNVSIWEGDSLDISCVVSEGNPSFTSIQWTRNQDSKMWTTKRLNITNVKRTDSSVYTCTAWNVMHPSNRPTENGTHSRMFTLNVKYKTTIRVFMVNISDGRYSYTLPENATFVLVCQADGNPLPNITIMYMNETLKYKTLSDKISVHTSASCIDHGEYTCQASNRDGQISTKSININVLCTPRRNPKVTIELVVASALRENKTFSYTALAYPHPTFIWYRHGSPIAKNDPRTIISSSNLQTNLTIYHVEENDFGPFMLHVANEVGSIIELFDLRPKEKAQDQTNSITSQHVAGIVVGTISVVVLCGILLSVFIYRRRNVNTSKSTASEQTPSTLPVPYENLKIVPVPNVHTEKRNETTNNQISETNVDHTYEGLTPQDNGSKTTYEDLHIQR